MKKFLYLLLLAVLVSAMLLTATGNAALLAMGQWLVVRTPVGHVDLIVALGGDRLRQEKAVDLYRRGVGKFIVFTGADARERDYGCLGVPPEATLPIEPSVFTTDEEARVVKELAEKNHFRSILVVTSPYHSRRALATFRRAFRSRAVEIELVACDNPAFLGQPWWKSHMGVKTVLTEYFGMGYYWVKGII